MKLEDFELVINYTFNDQSHLLHAIQHKSFNKNLNNERLEFLGDAILSSIISEFLYEEKINKDEGYLSQKRSIIVGRKHLNLVGLKLIAKNKITSNLKSIPNSVYGNTLEAIIGAIYIDKGLREAKIFIREYIYNSEFIDDLSATDFKTQLVKRSQKEKFKIEYKVEKKEGLDHKRFFLVAVFVNDKKIADAKASSIKEAEQKAAKKIINNIF